jgi:cytochrome c-type biogenesis protein CcmF
VLVGEMALAAAAVAALVAALSTASALLGHAALASSSTPSGTRPRIAPTMGDGWRRLAVGCTRLSIALAVTAATHFLFLLSTGGFSVRYVWQYTASHEGVLRRLSASLAGPEGSLLVWALLAAVAAGWSARRWHHSPVAQRRDWAIVHLLGASVALALLLVTVVSAPFQSFADAFPSLGGASPVEGRGLNPVLTNLWMPLHTLLTFAAYAVLGLVFAIGVVQLLRASQGKVDEALRWHRPGLRTARVAWLLLSLALLSGVVWAYEEMTFGWFWSWDPVETATLAVWLLLTAAVHAAGEDGGGRRQLVVTPLLMAVSFVGVVFASFVTRSGLHPSVHAFAGGSTGRYLGIGLAGLIVGVSFLALRARRATSPAPPRRPWMSWATWLLLVAAGLTVWGLGYPMAVSGLLRRSVELDGGFFTMWGYVVAVGLLLSMGFGMQVAQGRRRDAGVMLAIFAGLTVVAAVIQPAAALELMAADRRPSAGTVESLVGRASVLSLLPPAVYALMAVVERWWSGRADPSPLRRRRRAAGAAIHVGAIAAILGAVFATVLSSSVTVAVDPATGVGTGDGITVRITDLRRTQHFDGIGTLVEDRETAVLELSAGGTVIAAGMATLSTFPERAMGRHARMLIDRAPLGDLQVVYHGMAEMSRDGLPVTVRRVPLIGLLWLGLVLMVAGTAALMPAGAPRRENAALAETAGGRR